MHEIMISPIVLIVIGVLSLVLFVILIIRHIIAGKTNADLLEQNKRLMAIGNIYYSMHIINLKEDTVQEVNSSGILKEKVKIVGITPNASKLMKDIVKAMIVEDQIENALAFTDLSTLAERMKTEKTFFDEFQTKYSGWLRGRFIVIDRDEEGLPINVILATVIVDKERKKEEGLIQISHTDELTGANNRRAYEEKIAEYEADTPDDLVIVSLDLNGLKVVNDTKGHEAGDEMIAGAVTCIKNAFDKYGDVYRTGGDEFAALIRCDEAQLESVKEEFKNIVDSWSGKIVSNISISAGYVLFSENRELCVHEMLVLADSRMNKAKGEYYRSKGVDRRGQRDAHTALCMSYTKILRANITDDTYQLVNVNAAEQTTEAGFSDKLSLWLVNFAKSGMVHPDDAKSYLEKVDINYLRTYFQEGNISLMFSYRRKIRDTYRKVMMEIIPANDYKDDNQSLYLYVKDIDNAIN